MHKGSDGSKYVIDIGSLPYLATAEESYQNLRSDVTSRVVPGPGLQLRTPLGCARVTHDICTEVRTQQIP